MRKSVWLLSAALIALLRDPLLVRRHRPAPTRISPADRVLADRAGGGRAGRPGRGRQQARRHRHHRPGPPPAPSGRADRRDRRRRRRDAELRRDRHPPAQPARPVAARLLDRHRSERLGPYPRHRHGRRQSGPRKLGRGVHRRRLSLAFRASASTSSARSTGSRCCAARRAHCSAATPRPASSTSSPSRPDFTPRRSMAKRRYGNYNLRPRCAAASPDRSSEHARRPARRRLCASATASTRCQSGEPHDDQQPQPLLHPRPTAVPADDKLSVRLIGDYTWRNEACCGAVYVDNSVEFECRQSERGRPIRCCSRAPFRHARTIAATTSSTCCATSASTSNALQSGYRRNVSVTPGRDYTGKTKDWGVSGEVDCDLGARAR